MSKYSEKNFAKSFGHAIRGIKLAFKSQKNLHRQTVVACLAVFAAICLKFNIYEYCLLFIVIFLVFIAEIFNSSIEFTIDAIFKNKFSELAGMAKDMAAAAVCFASCLAVITGLILFTNKIINITNGVIIS